MLKGFRKFENGLPRCFLVCKKRGSLFCFRVLQDFHTLHPFRELPCLGEQPLSGLQSFRSSIGRLVRVAASLRARVRQAFFAFLLSFCHFYPATFWVIAVCRVADGVFLLSLICHFAAIFLHLPCFYSSTDCTDYAVFLLWLDGVF